jgi:hypothetical protein
MPVLEFILLSEDHENAKAFSLYLEQSNLFTFGILHFFRSPQPVFHYPDR